MLSHRRMIRAACRGAIAAVLTLALTQCGPPPSPTSGNKAAADHEDVAAGDVISDDAGNEPPADGDWLILRLGAEMPHLNPLTSQDAYSARINDLIFDSLLERDNETLEMEPHVAKSFEVSSDHLTYTFHLRDDVTFSDGVPLTAKDVKFSYEKIKDPEVLAPHLRNYFNDVTACEVLDDHTVRFTCGKPYFLHLVFLGGLDIIPKHVYGKGDFNDHPNNRNPIGSGPYVLEEWKTSERVVLARNEKFWNDAKKPHLLKRVYKLILDDQTALQALTSHDLDYMGLRQDQWIETANSDRFTAGFNKFSYYGANYSYIGWNMRRAKFSDKRVRRALTMLLDREGIRDAIYHGLARIVSGTFFIDCPEYNHDVKPWPFDPEAAKALLDEAGWSDSDGDGVRDKDGEPFAFELLIVGSSVNAERIGTIFQEELKRAGIEMSIRPLEWASFMENIDTRQFDACTLGWALSPDSDPYQLWHSSQAGKGSNHVGFVNEEADAIIEEARTEFDRDKRIKLYRRFHEIVHEEQPYTFLFCPKSLAALDKRFRNVRMYPFGPDSTEWFVPKALQRYGKQ